MKSFIKFRTAAKLLVSLLGALVLFHLLILVGIIPFNIVWGGRLQDSNQMFTMELVSVSINLAMIFFVLLRVEWLKLKISSVLPRIAMWLMVVLFAFNTLGNLISENEFEKMVFTPITILLTLLSLRLALKTNVSAVNRSSGL